MRMAVTMKNKSPMLANMNAGRALLILMSSHDIQAKELAVALGVSDNTISTLRNSRLISGSNLVMLSDHFGISAADFIRKGEEEA